MSALKTWLYFSRKRFHIWLCPVFLSFENRSRSIAKLPCRSWYWFTSPRSKIRWKFSVCLFSTFTFSRWRALIHIGLGKWRCSRNFHGQPVCWHYEKLTFYLARIVYEYFTTNTEKSGSRGCHVQGDRWDGQGCESDARSSGADRNAGDSKDHARQKSDATCNFRRKDISTGEIESEVVASEVEVISSSYRRWHRIFQNTH